MSVQSPPYSKYGSFLLFKKLEESSLAEIWRAAPIDSGSVGPHIALLRFTGGDIGALKRAAEQAAKSLKTLEGSTVVKGQTYHLVGKTPIITWDYVGGRSLYRMFQVAEGGPETPPNPFPVDQALAIAEKLALSLETTGHLKHGGHRLHHGVLVPQMIWVSEDGDIRTLGHQMTKGMLASLSRAPVQRQFGGFIAPELRRNGDATDPSEVWGIGANLYAMLTGSFLEPPTDQPAMDATIAEAALATDEEMPDELREVLGKSLAIDPARRYESPAALREALGGLIRGGEYAPTTFNLAFYVHNLLRDELEAEAVERENEKGVDPSLVPALMGATAADEPDEAPAAEPVAPPATVAPTAPAAAPVTSTPAKKSGGRGPMIAAIVVILLLAVGAGAYWFTMGPGASSSDGEQIADASAGATQDVAPPQNIEPIVEPLIATTDTGDPGSEIETTTTDAATGTVAPSEDALLRQKMIQEEIDRRLQAEILKLQSEYDRKLQQEKERQRTPEPPKRTTAATPTPQQKPAQPSAAEELDRKKLESQDQPASNPAAAATDTGASAATATTTTAQPAKPAVPPPPAVKEGDVIPFGDVDQRPKLVNRIQPKYPPLAARQKVEATIIVSVFVSETGGVLDAKILKGDQRRLGFDDAALDAIKRTTFQPAMKDGKRVRTWMPVPIFFKAQ